jgi:hypothetical protein
MVKKKAPSWLEEGAFRGFYLFSVIPLAYLPRFIPVVVVVMVVIDEFIYIVFYTLAVLSAKVKLYFSKYQIYLADLAAIRHCEAR